MGARGVFTVLGLTATAGAAYLALAPVSAEVSTSLFPDWVVENVQIRLGGKAGVTVTPGSSTAEVTCGSPAAPYEIRVDDANWISELIDQADRTETRISEACGNAIDARQQGALLAFIAAVVLFMLAIASGGRRHVATSQQRPPTPAGPPPGWYPDPTAAGALRWWNGVAWASPQTTAAPANSAGATDHDGAVTDRVDSEHSDDSEPRRDRSHSVAAGAGTFMVIVIIAVIVGNLKSSNDNDANALIGSDQLAPTTIDPIMLRQQDCLRNTFGAIDAAFDLARQASRMDQENSSLNLDGDSSWLKFGESLQGLNTRDCPADYRTAMIEFSNAWMDYGVDWRSSSKRISFDSISDDEAAAHARRINQARELLEDIAYEYDVSVGRVSYTIG